MKDRILKDGSRVWDIRVSLGRDKNGKQVIDYSTVGPFKGTLKQQEGQALKEEKRWKTELRKERETQRTAFVEPSNETIKKYLSDWLARKKPELRGTTYDLYERTIRLHITPYIGTVQVSKLSPAVAQRWLDDLGGKGKHRTVEVARMVLREAMRDAHNLGLVDQNVIDRTHTPKRTKDKAPVRALSMEELGFVIKSMSPHLRRMGAFLAYSGLRRGEACGLRWGDIDLEAGTVKVERQITPPRKEDDASTDPVFDPQGKIVGRLGPVKTKAGRRFFVLPPQAVAILKEQKTSQKKDQIAAGGKYSNPEGWVFAHELGHAMRPERVTRNLLRAAERLKIEGVSPHTFRHTCASMMIAAGSNIETVSKILGHESIAVTSRIYSHMLPEAGRDHAALFGTWLDETGKAWTQ